LDRCFAGEEVSHVGWFTNEYGRRYLAVTYSPLRPGSERVEAALAIARDFTEHMLASEALQQAQADLERVNRVMLLGEMTASIAHEVSQPIGGIGAADKMQKSRGRATAGDAEIGIAERDCGRGADDLLAEIGIEQGDAPPGLQQRVGKQAAEIALADVDRAENDDRAPPLPYDALDRVFPGDAHHQDLR
jgi:signal transduction histidine kinase